MAKKSTRQLAFEAIYIGLIQFIATFFIAWIVMLMYGAFRESFLMLPTIGYWAWFWGLNVVDWVMSIVFRSVNTTLGQLFLGR